jgi:alkane 1-monooxygenase
MTRSSTLKLAGYSLCLIIPLLAPLSVRVRLPWLAPVVVFGVLPVLGLIIGEDRSLPLVGLRRSRILVDYLNNLPRVYGLVWIGILSWAAAYAARSNLSLDQFAALTLTVGIASAVSVCTAHELMHRRSVIDVLLARVMTGLCFYGHMSVEHMHHHANIGNAIIGATALRGMSVYRFAFQDYLQGLHNVSIVETARLRRSQRRWWYNRLLQDYAIGLALAASFYGLLGAAGLILILGQAVFAVFVFEVITYVHHYGLVRKEHEEAGPQYAWAHHCWITNCVTFNNTFHSDHHLRPRTPYYELHAMYGVPHLPASYFTMFCVALVPPLWFAVMNTRLDAFVEARGNASGELPELVQAQRCR